MPTTLKDVAILAGVSITTASHALNGKQVNAQTREKVLEAAKKLKYHTSAIGRNLITNKSNTIGMFIFNSKKSRDMTEEISYYYAMMKGALSSIQQHEYVFNFEAIDWEDLEDKDFVAKKVFSRSIDGMILVPQFRYHYSFLSLLDEERFPYVVINSNISIRPENSVRIDNYRGGYIAADHLLTLGHKSIAIINGPENHKDTYDREKGFLSRLLESGIKYDRNNIIYSDFTHDGGYCSTKKILQEKSCLPSAIFCSNDYMASGAIAAIYEAGMKVPDDIALVGYDDTEISRCVYPKLTTIKSAAKDLGFLAAERVFELIQRTDKEAKLDEIVLEPSLIVRDSTIRV
ncbi:MAG: LacI family DNA-binding transcriptional regulator [Ruminiclostridium sp.]